NPTTQHFTAVRSEFLDTMRIVCVPVLDDNFSYLLIDEMGVTAAVDPAEPEKASCPQYISYVCHTILKT
ncbi:unnamed protein product, partial [Laminaria digitata]